MRRHTIPDDLGREIPHAVTRCSECRIKIKAADGDPEPLCWGCATRDEILAGELGKDPGPRVEPLPAVVEHQVPVEYARSDFRAFGLGLCEIESSKLTQSLAQSREERRRPWPVLIAFELGIVCTFLGLVVLAVSAVR